MNLADVQKLKNLFRECYNSIWVLNEIKFCPLTLKLTRCIGEDRIYINDSEHNYKVNIIYPYVQLSFSSVISCIVYASERGRS